QQLHCGHQDSNAGSLRSDQGAVYVEPIFGQQLIQIAAVNPSEYIRKSISYLVCVFIAQVAHIILSLTLASAFLDNLLKLFFGNSSLISSAYLSRKSRRFSYISPLRPPS